MRTLKPLLVLLAVTAFASPAFGFNEVNERLPLTMVAESCNGDLVEITGETHIVAGVTQSANGTWHLRVHTNSKGTGVGVPSGTQYVYGEVYNFREKFAGPGAQVVTEEISFRLISQGSTDNMMIHTILHITINSNGDITSVVANTRVECQG